MKSKKEIIIRIMRLQVLIKSTIVFDINISEKEHYKAEIELLKWIIEDVKE